MGKLTPEKILQILLHAATVATVTSSCTFSSLTTTDSPPCVGLISCSDHLTSVSADIRDWTCRRSTNIGNEDERDNTADENYTLRLKINNIETDIEEYNPFEWSLKKFEGHFTSIAVTNGTMNRIDEFFYRLHNATIIDLSYNNIRRMKLSEFSQLKQLEILNVSHNAIKSLDYDFSMNLVSSLTVVDLSHNLMEKIQLLDFLSTPQIHHLNLSYNSIDYLSTWGIEKVPNLQTLSITNNGLISISLQGMTNLQVLRIDFNNLCDHISCDISLTNMPKLKKLTVSNNNLSDIKLNIGRILSETVTLTELDLSHNSINNILKSQFYSFVCNLTCLDLSYNNISKIEPMAWEGKNITHFKMHNNRLTGLLDNHTFEGTNSDELDLSGGSITELGSQLFVGQNLRLNQLNFSYNLISQIQQSAFHNLELLTTLDLSNNKLKSIDFDSKDLRSLSHLYANRNLITKLTRDMLSKLVSLELLDVSYNAIEDIDERTFSNLDKLEFLIIRNNPLLSAIKADTFIGLKLPTRIDLTYTNITCLKNETFQEMVSLRSFNASFGEINKIEFNIFNGVASVEVIDLSHNQITIFLINNQNIRFVKEIYLSNNRLTHISNETFVGLSQLQILNLDYNNIVSIQTGSFTTAKSVNLLDLSNNNLLSLKFATFDGMENMKRLNLSRNRLNGVTADLFYANRKLEVIALDYNFVSHIDFNEIHDTNLKKLTMGGNLFTCTFIVKLILFLPQVQITAENTNYRRENVQGIICKSDSHFVNKNGLVENSTYSNGGIASRNFATQSDSHTPALNIPEEIACKNELKCVNKARSVSDTTKANEETTRSEFSRQSDSIIIKKLSELNSALYREAGCLLAVFVLFVTMFSLILKYAYKNKLFTHKHNLNQNDILLNSVSEIEL